MPEVGRCAISVAGHGGGKYLASIGLIWLLMLAFYTVGKYLLILTIPVLIAILKIRSSSRDRRRYIGPLILLLVVLACFLISFMTALSHGNELLHIIRNNFYTLAFMPLGFLFYSYYSRSSDVKPFLILMYGAGLLGIVQIGLYFAALLSADFMRFYNEVLIDGLGYTFAFAGRYEFGTSGIKLYSNLTPLYLFLIPVAFVDSRFPGWALGAALLIVLLSASVTQYFVLLVFLCAYVADCMARVMKGEVRGLRRLVFVGFACGLVVLGATGLGISGTVIQKLENFTTPQTREFNSVSIRARQADVLMREFEQHPWFGNGLGYISSEYQTLRGQFGDVKELNQSMYENQYLDIFMKFGLLAVPILAAFIVVPLIGLIRVRHRVQMSSIAVALGFTGVLIYAGSNGNAFYAYSTMFCWGMALAVGSSYPAGQDDHAESGTLSAQVVIHSARDPLHRVDA